MTLPYDYARCDGTYHEKCRNCLRRDPGYGFRQVYIVYPPINFKTGECDEFIGSLIDQYLRKGT